MILEPQLTTEWPFRFVYHKQCYLKSQNQVRFGIQRIVTMWRGYISKPVLPAWYFLTICSWTPKYSIWVIHRIGNIGKDRTTHFTGISQAKMATENYSVLLIMNVFMDKVSFFWNRHKTGMYVRLVRSLLLSTLHQWYKFCLVHQPFLFFRIQRLKK